MGIRGGIDILSPKEIESVCKIHGLYKHRKYNAGKSKSGKQTFRYRCKKCAVIAVEKRRKTLKLKALSYKGNKCTKCAYNKCGDALEFHHRDPIKKEFGIAADGCTKSWDRIKKELDKCDLLCSNCHREIHSQIAQLAEHQAVNLRVAGAEPALGAIN